MKNLRRTVRKIILENNQNTRYTNLLGLLDSYDLINVQQGIEICTALGFAEVTEHVVHKGLSPNAKSRGDKGINRCYHAYTLKLNKPFMEYIDQVFDGNGNKSPNQNVSRLHDFKFRNLAPRIIQVFASDENEKWSNVTEEWNDPSVTEVVLPV